MHLDLESLDVNKYYEHLFMFYKHDSYVAQILWTKLTCG